MCSLSGNSLLPSLRIMGNFPTGCILVPLAASEWHWMEGGCSRVHSGDEVLSLQQLRCQCLNLVRQTDVEPLSEMMWIGILRTGSVAATWLILEIYKWISTSWQLICRCCRCSMAGFWLQVSATAHLRKVAQFATTVTWKVECWASC